MKNPTRLKEILTGMATYNVPVLVIEFLLSLAKTS
jgi:hypothetical protein